MKTLHIITFSVVLALTVASLVMSILLFSSLPGQIPTHFGLSGAPDIWSNKSILMVFMVPLIQLAMFLLFLLLYKHPQYSSWPTTLILMTVEEKKREKLFAVIRGMLLATLFWISILFSYLQFVIFATANGRDNGVSPFAMITFLVLLFGTMFIYTGRMFVVVKKVSKAK